MEGKVRVRFAPSPTGYLHLGSARTALFNWLYARRTGGVMVLRIEDTDRERSKKEFLDEIIEDMKWMGLDWDEGPFFQSERADLYRRAADELLKKGLAYREGNAIIFKVEKGRVIRIDDLVHGAIEFNTDEIKDQVLIKSDGLPAYNFACVVDDNDMGITHIVRGDDHISNTPKQVLFYGALGYARPAFAHMPLMMGVDGAKLSKRHGGVAVFEYREEGFLPEALANYLLLLGWSPKDGSELISLGEAARGFDISDINDTQVRFDIQKLKWLNGEYIMRKDVKTLANLIRGKKNAGGNGFFRS
ncbi:MAG: glutamate--tRNA ligase family protein [Candidatus Omnitrophota bacterium]